MHTLLVTLELHPPSSEVFSIDDYCGQTPMFMFVVRHSTTILPRLRISRNHGLGDMYLRKVRVSAAACGGRTRRSSGFDVMQERNTTRALNMKLKLLTTVTSMIYH
jgi:hypothetical protein